MSSESHERDADRDGSGAQGSDRGGARRGRGGAEQPAGGGVEAAVDAAGKAGAATTATLELPLLDLPSAHPCHGCGECCHYVAVEIDKPTAFRDYDHVFWYLTHRHVTVYIDWEGGWFLEFETVCDHLTPGKTCGIYEQRPKICSSFSWEECERNVEERAWKYRFTKPDEFFEWLRKHRPRSYERYTKQRRRMLVERGRVRKQRSPVKRVG